ncbi:hypothetical protein BH09PAT3_BH09PAT3_4110 [soil metagenome]
MSNAANLMRSYDDSHRRRLEKFYAKLNAK